jgi:hypothetical protein
VPACFRLSCHPSALQEDLLAAPDRLLTDRTSYIAYLESSLERVSAACLTVQSFDERLEQAVGCIRGLEEKLLNMARLVRCTQQFAEAQEAQQREGAAEVGRRLRAVEAAVEELAQPGRTAEWEAKLRAGGRPGECSAWGSWLGHLSCSNSNAQFSLPQSPPPAPLSANLPNPRCSVGPR